MSITTASTEELLEFAREVSNHAAKSARDNDYDECLRAARSMLSTALELERRGYTGGDVASAKTTARQLIRLMETVLDDEDETS